MLKPSVTIEDVAKIFSSLSRYLSSATMEDTPHPLLQKARLHFPIEVLKTWKVQ